MLFVSCGDGTQVHEVNKNGKITETPWLSASRSNESKEASDQVCCACFSGKADTIFTCTPKSVSVMSLINTDEDQGKVVEKQLPVPSDYFNKITCIGKGLFLRERRSEDRRYRREQRRAAFGDWSI